MDIVIADTSDMVHNSTYGFWVFQGSSGLWGVLAAIAVLLLLSFCCNILCCVQKRLTAKGKRFLPRFRRSVSLKNREMEENPIYGNITYTHTHSDDKQEVESPGKLSSARECYANLSLRAPKPSGGRVSPLSKIQYSDVLVICEDQEEKNEEDKDSCSGLSDLYASVDAERMKSKKEHSNEPYANHV
ncbi:signaling threshold-regulating transmembrane adapter 1-like isoform X2 [Tachysurus fulvidraco]|uniref:signaling threshold-regulating transmembrane adapter 1-like isoform X2 n=1 Tax=Tachysurus fulvidraco TaxID=1234273 RepID=UPI001FEEE05E|nr:signaling threshold-regulating transmembrane adapter 1-like isoform X2 [Tachysurus fulvidraco]